MTCLCIRLNFSHHRLEASKHRQHRFKPNYSAAVKDIAVRWVSMPAMTTTDDHGNWIPNEKKLNPILMAWKFEKR